MQVGETELVKILERSGQKVRRATDFIQLCSITRSAELQCRRLDGGD